MAAVLINGEDGGVYLWDREGATATWLSSDDEVRGMIFLGYHTVEGELNRAALSVFTAGGRGRPNPAGGY